MSHNAYMNSKRAFTLLEVIVVLAVLAILVSATMVATSDFRQTNRDVARVADVGSIRAALADYYKVFNSYPTAITAGQSLSAYNAINTSTLVFLSSIPSNPQPVDGNCPATTTYGYTRSTDGTDYALTFCLGSRVNDWGPATNTISAENDSTCVSDCVMSCGAGSDGCGGACVTSTCSGSYTCVNDHCMLAP